MLSSVVSGLNFPTGTGHGLEGSLTRKCGSVTNGLKKLVITGNYGKGSNERVKITLNDP